MLIFASGEIVPVLFDRRGVVKRSGFGETIHRIDLQQLASGIAGVSPRSGGHFLGRIASRAPLVHLSELQLTAPRLVSHVQYIPYGPPIGLAWPALAGERRLAADFAGLGIALRIARPPDRKSDKDFPMDTVSTRTPSSLSSSSCAACGR